MDNKLEKKAYDLYNEVMINPLISKSLKQTVPPPYHWLAKVSDNYHFWKGKGKAYTCILNYHTFMCNIADLSGTVKREEDRRNHLVPIKQHSRRSI